jgi:hypothetical protein
MTTCFVFQQRYVVKEIVFVSSKEPWRTVVLFFLLSKKPFSNHRNIEKEFVF